MDGANVKQFKSVYLKVAKYIVSVGLNVSNTEITK